MTEWKFCSTDDRARFKLHYYKSIRKLAVLEPTHENKMKRYHNDDAKACTSNEHKNKYKGSYSCRVPGMLP